MRLSVVGQRALHFQHSAPKLRGFHADFCGDKQNSGEISALKALSVTTQAPGNGALDQLSNYLRCFISSLCHPPSLYHSSPLPLPHARALSPSLPLSLPLSLFLSTGARVLARFRSELVINFACFLIGQGHVPQSREAMHGRHQEHLRLRCPCVKDAPAARKGMSKTGSLASCLPRRPC